MKLDSKYFDSIRIKPGGEPRPERVEAPCCQWKGCQQGGTHRAPKGRGREGQYYLFCLDHVRQYNATYNYFDGMSDADVERFHKDATTGHRPTWKVGANAWAHGVGREGNPATDQTADPASARLRDPHGFFAWRAKQARAKAKQQSREGRQLKPLEKKALEALHLEADATREEIKARFKELVKRHHPDVNGGDNSAEEKLREIIQAYNQLKQAGLA